MPKYASLELSLRRFDATAYSVDLRFTAPDSDADVRPIRQAIVTNVDHEALLAAQLDPHAYGRLLANAVFADVEARRAFAEARAVARSREMLLRVRLALDAVELHQLHWETLCDPEDGQPLALKEQVLLSRYLSSADWRPVRLRPRSHLRVLLAITSPTDLDTYRPSGVPLATIDRRRELLTARYAIGDLRRTELVAPGSGTFDRIVAALRDGYDILHLVCHGALIEGQPRLWFERPDGSTEVVDGAELARCIGDLPQRPRLVVLASCQSAGGSSESSALTALGPRLAAEGVPAVLAMQGPVSIATVALLLPVLYRELERDGQIDRALAVARQAVRNRHDAFVPVLFSRLQSGRIWYEPGFSGDQPGFEKWPSLLRHIAARRCTPIIGPGLIEFILGSTRDVARRWADTYHYPMEPHDREDLPQVAQYLAVQQEPRFPHDELRAYLLRAIRTRHSAATETLPDSPDDPSELDGLVTALGEHVQAAPSEPHRVLAALGAPLYLTANPDTLLERALERAGREPLSLLCPWNEDLVQQAEYTRPPEGYRPSPARPLVYHLFGLLRVPESYVLTEDEYFDFLIGVTRNNSLIPAVVRSALTNTALLFLGFQIDDWNFRVLFRSIMQREGRQLRRRYTHVAVQVNPDDDRFLDPASARRYLERYFGDADISIYWGSAEDFAAELHRLLVAASRHEVAP